MSNRTDALPHGDSKLQDLTSNALKADKVANAAKEKVRTAKTRMKVAKRELKVAKSNFKAIKKLAKKVFREAKHAHEALEGRLDQIAKGKTKQRKRSVAATKPRKVRKTVANGQERTEIPLPPASANSG